MKLVRTVPALVGLVLLVACAPATALTPASGVTDPAPRQPKADRDWAYAIDLLKRRDDAGALTYLERAVEVGGDPSPMYQVLLLRDVAELRLAAGDTAGAVAAADQGTLLLGKVERSATFSDEDRRLNRMLMAALRAAGNGDAAALEALTRTIDAGYPKAADPWFLLGQVRERAGDTAGAQRAYRAYLDRLPEFGILRRTTVMRAYAARTLGLS